MLKESTRTIKNTETTRNKILECLELINEKTKIEDKENNDLEQIAALKLNLEKELNEEYLKFETIQSLKSFWNKNSTGIFFCKYFVIQCFFVIKFDHIILDQYEMIFESCLISYLKY
jgi:hypothetical protein